VFWNWASTSRTGRVRLLLVTPPSTGESLCWPSLLLFLPLFTITHSLIIDSYSWTSYKNLLTYGAEPFLRSCQLCTHSRTSQHFMEPEVSSPYSQEPPTGPYPEPSHPVSLRSILILYIHLRLGLPNGFFPLLVVPPISYMHSSSPNSCYMPWPSHPPWHLHSNYVWWGVTRTLLIFLFFFTVLWHGCCFYGYRSITTLTWKW
jgi:hypothetical protein